MCILTCGRYASVLAGKRKSIHAYKRIMENARARTSRSIWARFTDYSKIIILYTSTDRDLPKKIVHACRFHLPCVPTRRSCGSTPAHVTYTREHLMIFRGLRTCFMIIILVFYYSRQEFVKNGIQASLYVYIYIEKKKENFSVNSFNLLSWRVS